MSLYLHTSIYKPFLVEIRKKGAISKKQLHLQLKQRNRSCPFAPRHNFHDTTTRDIHWIMLSSETPSHIPQNQQSSRKFSMLFTPFCCLCLKFPVLFCFCFSWSFDVQISKERKLVLSPSETLSACAVFLSTAGYMSF